MPLSLSFSLTQIHTHTHTLSLCSLKHKHSAAHSRNIRIAGCPPASLSPSLPLIHSGRNASSCRPVPPLLSVTVATSPLQPWRPASRIQASLTSASSLCSSPWEVVSTANTSVVVAGMPNKCVIRFGRRVVSRSCSVQTVLILFVCLRVSAVDETEKHAAYSMIHTVNIWQCYVMV